MIGDLRKAQSDLADYYAKDMEKVLNDIANLTQGERTSYLTKRSCENTDLMMKRWDKLARMLIVKYNDQVVYPEENGEFVSGRYKTPGYNQNFIDAISSQTGNRYKLKKLIERRER